MGDWNVKHHGGHVTSKYYFNGFYKHLVNCGEAYSFQSEPSVQLPQENEARVVAARGLMRIKYSNRTVLRVGTVWQHDEQSEVTIFDKGRRKL
jgi:hypothetical protein